MIPQPQQVRRLRLPLAICVVSLVAAGVAGGIFEGNPRFSSKLSFLGGLGAWMWLMMPWFLGVSEVNSFRGFRHTGEPWPMTRLFSVAGRPQTYWNVYSTYTVDQIIPFISVWHDQSWLNHDHRKGWQSRMIQLTLNCCIFGLATSPLELHSAVPGPRSFADLVFDRRLSTAAEWSSWRLRGFVEGCHDWDPDFSDAMVWKPKHQMRQ